LSPDIIGINVTGTIGKTRHVAEREVKRNAYEIIGRKPEEETPLGRFRIRWEDNIHMDLKKEDARCGLDARGSRQGPVVREVNSTISYTESDKTWRWILNGYYASLRPKALSELVELFCWKYESKTQMTATQ
jgi:hypothetical protein